MSPCEGSVALAFGDKHHTTQHRRRMMATSSWLAGWLCAETFVMMVRTWCLGRLSGDVHVSVRVFPFRLANPFIL
jgi:hypothetical protein